MFAADVDADVADVADVAVAAVNLHLMQLPLSRAQSFVASGFLILDPCSRSTHLLSQ